MQTGSPPSALICMRANPCPRQGGFAYVFLLAAVAVLGMVAANTVSTGSLIARRDAEQSLLAIGGEFESALRSYARLGTSSPAGPSGPRTLEELLKDPRAPGVVRHLRQIYADPLTGKADWGLSRDPAGFILAVYSMADGVPIQQAQFPASRAHFERATRYADWTFGLITTAASAQATTPGPTNRASPTPQR